MATIRWASEFGSGLPQATIGLDSPVYSGVDTTNIVGAVAYRGMEVVITFDSEAGARIAMPTVLQQLKGVGAIHGYLYDNRTNASVH
jgi:hypothetical protein